MCFPNVAPLGRVENSQEIFEKLRETDSSAGVFYFFCRNYQGFRGWDSSRQLSCKLLLAKLLQTFSLSLSVNFNFDPGFHRDNIFLTRLLQNSMQSFSTRRYALTQKYRNENMCRAFLNFSSIVARLRWFL